MNILVEMKDNEIVSELSNTLCPTFYIPANYSTTLPKHTYLSGLYNLKDGVCSLSNKGREFFDELGKIDFEVTKMNIKKGHRNGIQFELYSEALEKMLGPSAGNTTLTFRDNSTLDSWYGRSDECIIAKLAAFYNVEKIIPKICEFMGSSKSIARMYKSENTKDYMTNQVNYKRFYNYNKNTENPLNFDRDSALHYLMDKFLMLDFPCTISRIRIEELAVIAMDKLSYPTEHAYFKSGRTDGIPVRARLGLYIAHKDEPGYDKIWQGTGLDSATIANSATTLGYVDWIEGVMDLKNIGPIVKAEYEAFRDKFVEFFNNGRWRISTYTLRYSQFTVEYLPNNNTEAQFQIEYSGTSTDCTTLKLFKMFDVMPTLVDSLCKTLSQQMITELATSTLINQNEGKREGNVRDIIGMMSDRFEQIEKERGVKQ